MLASYSLDQLFLQLRGGHLQVLLVLENSAGARHRETLSFPTRNTVEAVRRVAKHLAYRGDVEAVRGVRLRREERSVLKDDDALRRLFISEFEQHAGEDAWD